MKQVDEMPTGGQFVAVWQYNKKPWSEVYEWDDDSQIDELYIRRNAVTAGGSITIQINEI